MTDASFTFTPIKPADRKQPKLVLNDEEFVLENNLTGFELLNAVATTNGPGSTLGIVNFYRRVIKDDDWARFIKTTDGMLPKDLAVVCGKAIDAYCAFPTTLVDTSSDGS